MTPPLPMTAYLVAAAERGVAVTIFTNDYPAPSLTLKWRHQEYRDAAVATFRGAGLEARVVDMDGDMSDWTVKRGKEIIAEGGEYKCDPYYHFDACLLAAEAAVRSEVKRRIGILRGEAYLGKSAGKVLVSR